MKILKIVLKTFLFFAILGAGILGTIYLINSRPEPKKQEIKTPPTLVEIVLAQRTTEQITLPANGTVKPAQQVELKPEVSGRIIEMNPNLVPGGVIRKGEVIVRIDPRDYEFIVEQRKARAEEAQFLVTEEMGRTTVAEREWKLLGSEVKTTDVGRELALRRPHLRKAKASLQAASSALEDALLDLKRTVIRAPFNALIQQESVDIGQLVTPQSTIASLAGTDTYWVQASVYVSTLPWIPLPHLDGTPGAPVRISRDLGNGPPLEWDGRVVRLLGSTESFGRMARLLIAINDPLSLKNPAFEDRVPLLLDDYVNLDIEGKELRDVIALPSQAVREGNQVWIMNEQDQLEIRPVEIAWEYEQRTLIYSGVKEGERIIVSRLSAPVRGTNLTVSGQDMQEIVHTSDEPSRTETVIPETREVQQ